MVVALVILSAYRLTRLLVKDSFPPIAVQRSRVNERWGDDSWQAYLASCSWCAGIYVSGLLVLGTDLVLRHLVDRPGVPLPILTWGGAAAACGFLAAWDDGPKGAE